jgi:hypothetical protein
MREILEPIRLGNNSHMYTEACILDKNNNVLKRKIYIIDAEFKVIE